MDQEYDVRDLLQRAGEDPGALLRAIGRGAAVDHDQIRAVVRDVEDVGARDRLRRYLPVRDAERRADLMERLRKAPTRLEKLDEELLAEGEPPLGAILPADIVMRLSGGAGNADPNASLGGVISSTAWAGGTLHDLFDVITGDENVALESEYRGLYVRNSHATLTLIAPMFWLTSPVSGGADVTVGLDPAGVGNGSTTGVMATIANENTAPAGVTFSNPTTKAGGLAITDLAPGNARGWWARRTTTNSAAINADGVTFNVEGDTAA